MALSLPEEEHQNLSPDLDVNLLLEQLAQVTAEALDWPVLIERVLKIIIPGLQADYGEYWYSITPSSRLMYGGSWPTSVEMTSEERYCSYGEGLAGEAWQRGRWHWQRLLTLQDKEAYSWSLAGISPEVGAVVTLPLDLSASVGVLCLFYQQGRSPSLACRLLLDCLQAQLKTLCQMRHTLQDCRAKQQRYQRLIDVMPGIVFQANHDTGWSMQYLSAGSEVLTGYRPEELVDHRGQHAFNAITHPQDLARVLHTIDDGIRTHQAYQVEYRLRSKAGADKWVWEQGHAVYDFAGQLQGIEGFITDITDRKTVEQLLESRDGFLRLVLNSIPSPVFWKNRQGQFLGCNRAFARAMGQDHPDQIVGLTDFDLPQLSDEEAAYYQACDRMVMTRGEADLDVIEPQSFSDGQRRWIKVSRLPIRDGNGDVIGILGVFDDITEQLQAQQSLELREKYLTTISDIQRSLLAWHWDSTDSPIETILAGLGETAQASRVYCYELAVDSAGQSIARQRLEWTAPGISSTKNISVFQTIPIDPFLRDWITALSRGESINLTQAELTEAQWQLLAPPPSNVQSLLILPLIIKGKLEGAMGFSNCNAPRRWTNFEVELLRVATADLALAIERRRAEDSLKQTEAKFRSIFENAVEGIFQTTLEGRFTTVNPMLAELYGYDSPEDLMFSLTDIGSQLYVNPECRQRFIRKIAAEGAVFGFEAEVYHKDGSIIWIAESARAVRNVHGHIVGYEGTVEDITARKRGEAEIFHRDRLLRGVAEASHQLLSIANCQQAIPQVLETLGDAAAADRVYIYEHHRRSDSGALAMSMRFEWTRPGIAPSIDQPHWQNKTYPELGVERWYESFVSGGSIRGLVRNFPPVEQQLLGRDDIRAILMVPIFVEQQLWGYIGFDACRTDRDWTVNDESILVAIAATLGAALKRQQTEAKMSYQAYHDSLTGLPNRSFFNQRLPQAIDQARCRQQSLAVVFLDLDHFKTINDTLSHAVGDELLRQVTQRIAKTLNKDDIVARWGGDEFTLILPAISTPEDAAQTAMRIAQDLKPPFLLHGHELHITISMGIAQFPQDGEDMTTLLQNADAAMYQAKSRGRNNYQFYTQHLGVEAAQRLKIESVLHHALQRQEFRLYYQPQIDTTTGRVSQMEALIRWQHPELGTISPAQFIPLAEDNGLIIPIGEWVIREACTQAVKWLASGLTTARVAVNLSARQLQHPHLVNHVAQVLAETGLPSHCLELEITETAAMADVESSVRRLQELKELGVKASMDDFGTGYSCLSYLKQFPLDGLKVDRAFIKDLATCTADQAMVQAVIAMAQGLRLTLVAEGVETQNQVDYLNSIGCHHMQGYFFSRPMSADETYGYLRQVSPHGLISSASLR
jgi:diguanylate cyclase (GGDEF)-like protein/PAS domain S-box-containing protein